jgi:hypothetical protein
LGVFGPGFDVWAPPLWRARERRSGAFNNSARASGDQLNSSEATPFGGQYAQQGQFDLPPNTMQITPDTHWLSNPDLQVHFEVNVLKPPCPAALAPALGARRRNAYGFGHVRLLRRPPA